MAQGGGWIIFYLCPLPFVLRAFLYFFPFLDILPRLDPATCGAKALGEYGKGEGGGGEEGATGAKNSGNAK